MFTPETLEAYAKDKTMHKVAAWSAVEATLLESLMLRLCCAEDDEEVTVLLGMPGKTGNDLDFEEYYFKVYLYDKLTAHKWEVEMCSMAEDFNINTSEKDDNDEDRRVDFVLADGVLHNDKCYQESCYDVVCEITVARPLQKKRRAKKHKKRVFTSDACVICLVNPVDDPFMPCGHVCVCTECYEKATFSTCPLCRAMIT